MIACISPVESKACFFLITNSSTSKKTGFLNNFVFGLLDGLDTYLLLVCSFIFMLWVLWCLFRPQGYFARGASRIVNSLLIFSLLHLLSYWNAPWIQLLSEPQTWLRHKKCGFLQNKTFQRIIWLFYNIPHLLEILFLVSVHKFLTKMWPPGLTDILSKK